MAPSVNQLPTGPHRHFEPRSHIEQPACSPGSLAQRLRACASELGLAGLGFAAAEPFEQAEQALSAWLDAGYHGTMDYMVGPRSEPRRLAPAACTVVVTAMTTQHLAAPGRKLPLLGQVAAYAQGADYHVVLREKLGSLAQCAADVTGRSIQARICVDTAPLLEREAARRAGLGFIGKSNMLIMPGIGSHVLLGVLLLDIDIAADEARDQRCGRCTTCLTACPTQAFVGPWLLDARRCIAYLTIEYKGWIARGLRPLIGTRMFGCDVCQDVCPFNHGKGESHSLATAASHGCADVAGIASWLRMSSSDYRRLTSGTALRRASRWQLQRNAAVAAGNAQDESLIEPLAALLLRSTYPIVRGHAAWALGCYSNAQAHVALGEALDRETNQAVIEEIDESLAQGLRQL